MTVSNDVVYSRNMKIDLPAWSGASGLGVSTHISVRSFRNEHFFWAININQQDVPKTVKNKRKKQGFIASKYTCSLYL